MKTDDHMIHCSCVSSILFFSLISLPEKYLAIIWLFRHTRIAIRSLKKRNKEVNFQVFLKK